MKGFTDSNGALLLAGYPVDATFSSIGGLAYDPDGAVAFKTPVAADVAIGGLSAKSDGSLIIDNEGVIDNYVNGLPVTSAGNLVTTTTPIDASTAYVGGIAVNPAGVVANPAGLAVEILKRFGTDAHVYLPGIGVLNGLQAANYVTFDPAQPTVVDYVVGGVLDAAGTVGPELEPNTGPYTVTTGWAAVQSTLSTAGGELLVTQTSGAYGQAYHLANLETGKTYKLSGTCRKAGTATGAYLQIQRGAAGGYATLFQTTPEVLGVSTAYTGYFTATGTDAIFNFTVIGAPGATGYFSAFSVKEVTGIHATQTTTGNKPKLRRGSVNLCTQSQNIADATWVKTGGANTITTYGYSAPDGSMTAAKVCAADTITAGARGLYNATNSVVAGNTYTTSCYVKSAGLPYALIFQTVGFTTNPAISVNLTTGAVAVAGGSPTNLTSVALPDGWFRVSFTSVADVTTAISRHSSYCSLDGTWVGRGYIPPNITDGYYFWGAQLVVGTQMGDYAPTTTVAASNPNAGRYSWEFDGTDDYLTLSSVPFQMNDDFAVVAGMSPNVNIVNTTIYGQARSDADTTTNVICDVNGGVPRVFIRDSASTIRESSSGISVPIGAPSVLTFRQTNSYVSCRSNGGTFSTPDNVALNGSVFTVATIGCRPTPTKDKYLNGSLWVTIVIKGVVSNAELLLLEKFVGQLSGVTI